MGRGIPPPHTLGAFEASILVPSALKLGVPRVLILENDPWTHRVFDNFSCVYMILMTSCYVIQESHAVAGKPRDAAVNSDRYRVCWHFAGAISVSQMQSVSGCTVYA